MAGNPKNTDPQPMYKQIRANISSFPRTLGGDNHGRLGLVTDTFTQNRILPANNFVCPIQPSPLGSSNTVTEAQIVENICHHNLAITNFYESNNIKRTIINKIRTALAESVRMPKINKDTDVLDCTVTDILRNILGYYSNISDQKLHEERICTTKHKYINRYPIVNVFNAISKYSTMAEAHKNPETNGQLIIIGMIIITNARIFAYAVEKWNNKFKTDKGCPNFKTHFTEA